MLISRLPGLGLVALAGFLAACVPVTVNINFPQEKLEGAADQVEDMVRSPENPKPQPPKKGPQSGLADRLLAAVAPGDASAQTRNVSAVPEIRVRTPELMKAIESRRARFPQIRRWKEPGCIGETNQGLLEVRPGQGCTSEVTALVAAENADRIYIYDTLMQQNNIPASDAARVRAAFAKARLERARPGDWIQTDAGQWIKK
jgi:uncharacterized protein YdbL (DUF1318 family)